MTDEDGDASGSWLVDDEQDDHDTGAVEGKPVSGDWLSESVSFKCCSSWLVLILIRQGCICWSWLVLILIRQYCIPCSLKVATFSCSLHRQRLSDCRQHWKRHL